MRELIRLPLFCARLLFLLSFTSIACLAQFTGSIQGVVHDESGALVPNAKITLVNQETGVQTTATSDQAGNYRYVSLAPGTTFPRRSAIPDRTAITWLEAAIRLALSVTGRTSTPSLAT
jgi:Carboxypeptidase regulatory-like domain